MNSSKLKLIVCLALTGSISGQVWAGDIYVVMNNSLTLSADEIRDVYMGEKQISGGVKLVPLDNAVAQKEFLEKALKSDVHKYNAMWIKKGFRDGLNSPPVKSSDAEIISAVKANPAAIGYISSAPKDLKVIGKF